jgi:type IV secretory pathway VirB3-like protein
MELNTATIYGAIMRPPMFLGVHVDFIPWAFITMSLLFVINPAVGFLSIAPLWFIGWMMGKFDPDAMQILLKYHEIMKLQGQSFLLYLPC